MDKSQLAAKGARRLPMEGGRADILRLFDRPVQPDAPDLTGRFFETPMPPEEAAVREEQGEFAGEAAVESGEWEACRKMTFCEIFLRRMELLTARGAMTVDELLAELDVSKAQLNAWLKRATEEGKLEKTKSPARYGRLPSEPKPRQASIF